MSVENLDPNTASFFKDGAAAMEKEPPQEPAKEVAQEPVKEAAKEPVKEAEAAKEAPKAEKPPQDFVPHAALHEERERRKAIQAQVAEMQKKNEAMEARFAQLMERFKPQPPDPQQDPAGHLMHRTQELEAELKALKDGRQGDEQKRQQVEQWQRFQQAYAAQAQQFAATQKDWNNAYKHVTDALIEDFTSAGYDPATAQAMANQQEFAIVSKAFQDGVNPAERLYTLAKRRGYNAESKPDADKRLELIEKGQKAAPEFSASGGGKPKLTLEAVAAMSDEEFAEFDWDKQMPGLAA